jgi:hypothetical protein
VEVLDFGYHLVYDSGDPVVHPIGPAEAPLNLIAVAEGRGPLRAVAWHYPTKTWTFQPRVADAILFRDTDEDRTRWVDRATAEHEASRFASIPLPTAEALTAICRASQPV